MPLFVHAESRFFHDVAKMFAVMQGGGATYIVFVVNFHYFFSNCIDVAMCDSVHNVETTVNSITIKCPCNKLPFLTAEK